MQFSRIRNIVLLVQNRTIFAVQIPATVSTPHSKFQLHFNRAPFGLDYLCLTRKRISELLPYSLSQSKGFIYIEGKNSLQTIKM